MTLRICVLFASLVVLAPRAHADPHRVLVIDFEGGAKARGVQEAVVRMLPRAQYTVLEVRAVGSEADAIAAKLEADVRISGKVEINKRRHFIFRLQLDDQPFTTLDLGRRNQLTRPAAAALGKKLRARLAKLPERVPTEVPPPQQVELAAVAPPEPTPVEPAPIVVEKPVATPPPAPARFENFALHRSAIPRNLITLRGYWDSRDVGAIEQVLGFRAPLDVSFFARTTVRTDTGERTDLSVFAIDAFVMSPMVGSLGVFANIGSASGTDNDAVRVGLGQTLVLKAGALRIFSMAMIAPYQTSGAGGRMIGLLTLTLGPLRSETVAAYGWPAFSKLSDPNVVVVRPDLRVRVWKSFGVYAQYDYNNTLAEKTGLRTGGELAGAF